ncbi:hypothetical protein L198_06340 [Cryptococcus wingfieldii CBS 7118]|uniref:Uncharacterized protein n=1 Tax=Cryptococcus wingfieldii CBS 7118 TaxID=1295528 RepID=A0A1E3IM40_9TREE|nr:hypothetical protein L198_06340 [Cryptococcus wingfieldii CBS 7118]ODN89652.1 hypothetical protein L198_06340 [Cryptococcus wingfieldii CBS 7118]
MSGPTPLTTTRPLAQPTSAAVAAAAAAPPSGLETDDVSVAPALEEADAETLQEAPTSSVLVGDRDHGDVQKVAEGAEGKGAVPPGLGVDQGR